MTVAVANVFLQITLLAAVLSLLVITVVKKQAAKPASEVSYRTELMMAAVQHTINGIIVVDENWHIKFWSSGAEKIFGWKETEVRNQPLSIIFSNDSDFHRLIDEPRDYTRQQEFTGKHRLSGASFTNDIPIGITLNEFPIGTMRHFTCIVKNIRERIAHEQQLHAELELLNIGEEIAEQGTFMWNVSTNRVLCSDGMRELFNMDDFVSDVEEMMRSVWWEDQQKVREVLYEHLKKQQDYTLEYRISQPNGKPIYVRSCAKMFFKDGVLDHVCGIVQKIPNGTRAMA